LPSKITRVQVYFTEDEKAIHSIIFLGSSIVKLGRTFDQYPFHSNVRRARLVEEKFGPNEELMGCEIYHSEKQTVGVIWFKWVRPT